MVGRHLGHLASEGAGAGADDAAMGGDAVRLRDRGGLVERGAQLPCLRAEVGVQRQLLGDDERRHEDDARAAIGCEPAREVERMLRLRSAEQRDDDRPVAHGDRSAREAPGATVDGMEARPPHRSSW